MQENGERVALPAEVATDRLILRTSNERYAEEAAAFFKRNRDFHKPWSPVRKEGFFTIAHHRNVLHHESEQIKEDRLFKVWIYEKAEPGRIIGFVALNNIIRGVFQSCHLGYSMDAGRLNRGYMTEAIREVIKVAFHTLELHRIEANIMPHNKPSLHVVKKLGFQEEGLARKYLKIHGEWQDHIHMTLLSDKPC